MTMKTGSELRFEEGSWQEAAHDTYIGLLVGLGHVYKIFVKMPYEAVFSSQQYATLKDSDTDNALKNGGELKVVGVGFGRTGTVRVLVLVNMRTVCKACAMCTVL